MTSYRRHFDKAVAENRAVEMNEVRQAVIEGALLRVRPIMMTVAAIIAGLLPIMLGGGTGSEVMRRIAAPMVGGILTSFVGELIFYPAIYFLWRSKGLRRTALFPRRRPIAGA